MKSQDEDLTDGLAYGYPVCCILTFLNRGGTANCTQALVFGIRDKANPHVPCWVLHFPDYWPEAYG